MNFWGKRIQSNNKEIAEKLGVDEEKIEALKNGSLEIKGETMTKTLEAIEDAKINKAINDYEIWKWIKETDFREKRMEFGYKTITELARIMGVSTSTLSRLETNKDAYPKLTPTLTKIYEFYQSEFNKNTGKKAKVNNIDRSKKINKSYKEIWDWYKNTDIRKLRIEKGFQNMNELAPLIGSCSSCLSDLENKKFKRVNNTIMKAYNYFNKEDEPTNEIEVLDAPVKGNINVVSLSTMEDAIRDLHKDEVDALRERINELELQISRYEKLIDRL